MLKQLQVPTTNTDACEAARLRLDLKCRSAGFHEANRQRLLMFVLQLACAQTLTCLLSA